MNEKPLRRDPRGLFSAAGRGCRRESRWIIIGKMRAFILSTELPGMLDADKQGRENETYACTEKRTLRHSPQDHRAGADAAGSHPLLFRIHRRRAHPVQYAGTAQCAAVPVLHRGGLCPYPGPEALFSADLGHWCGDGGGAVLYDVRGDAAPGRWLLPAERDLSELEPALCPVAGDGLAAGQALSPGGGGHFGGPAVALCGGGAADGFSPDLPASGRLIGGGLSHHQSAAHVVRHHGRRMELFAGGRAAVPAAQPPDPSGRRLGAEQLNVSCSACWRRWGG